MSGTPIPCDYINAEGEGWAYGRAADGHCCRGRTWARLSCRRRRRWKPSRERRSRHGSPMIAMPDNTRWFPLGDYGLTNCGDLFTPRQLVALTTFSDLVQEARERMKRDALAAGLPDDGRRPRRRRHWRDSVRRCSRCLSWHLRLARCADRCINRLHMGQSKRIALSGTSSHAKRYR